MALRKNGVSRKLLQKTALFASRATSKSEVMAIRAKVDELASTLDDDAQADAIINLLYRISDARFRSEQQY